MPRLVDHDDKRREIIAATWRLLASGGSEAATMREIAAEAGYANGALTHYFANKDELLRAAYLHVWDETNRRIERRLGGATGLDAVRTYCREIAPTSRVARLEARVVLPFFARAATDPELAEITSDTWDRWRHELAEHVDHARGAGEIAVATPTPVLVEQLLALLLGLQTATAVETGRTSAGRPREREVVERFLASWQTPPADSPDSPDSPDRRRALEARVNAEEHT